MPVYVDANGNMYEDTSAHSVNDSQIVSISAALLATLTTTPQPIINAEGAAAVVQEDSGAAATDSGGPIG